MFQLSRGSSFWLLLLVGLSTGTALCLRYGLIENAALGLGCDASGASFLCKLRQALIWIFNANLFGGLALGAAAVCVARPSIAMTALTIVSASLGLALYNTAVSALAAGLVILAFARPAGAEKTSSKA